MHCIAQMYINKRKSAKLQIDGSAAPLAPGRGIIGKKKLSVIETQELRIIPDMGITLPDGIRLSARVWMPADRRGPLPAILEYLPYRKTDGTAARDHGMHAHFARHGYVCLRVDRRGCGDSEGLFDDEYSEQELQDGVDVVNWIAAQEWCDGNVGMQGISWGGFNSLQIAARAPEPLKAVITIASSVDRYGDDIHYKGGIQLGANIGWAAVAMSWFSMPPDPHLVGDRWRELWMARLQNTPFLAREWMRHPDRDTYWKHGSVCEDYSAIRAAVLAMGGLHDGYRNTVPQLVSNLQAPVRGVAGPWNHKYPHISTIGPSIDYLNEALRWWDRWLKGVDTGVKRDPGYRVYIMDSVPPDRNLDHRPGRWVAEPGGPSDAIVSEVLALADGTLGMPAPFNRSIAPDLAVGGGSGEYFPFGFGPGELPDDQSEDDALSACFDSMPLTQDWDIVGAPQLSLRVAADTPSAQLVARLCDLRPDGTSAFVSIGLLNLRHRDGFEAPTDLEPGRYYDVCVALDQVAYRLPAGHRLRVAISSSYWPYCWPEGRNTVLTLVAGELRLPRRSETGGEIFFDGPVPMDERPCRILRGHSGRRDRREADGRIVFDISGDHGRLEDLENGLITESAFSERWEINRFDPATAQVEIQWSRGLERGDWKVSTVVTTRMWGHETDFFFKQKLEAFENGELVFEKTMQDRVPRYAADCAAAAE